MVNRKQFGRGFAEAYGITYKSADQIVRDIFEYLGTVVFVEGEDLTIPGFGAFKHKTAKPKRVRHPATGEVVTKPARDFVKFTPSEMLNTRKE